MKNTVQKRGKHDKHNGLKTQPTNNMKTNWNMPLFAITPSALSIIMQHMHACSLVPAFFHPGRLGSQIFPLLPTCVRGSKADLDLWACRICCTCLVGRAGLVSVAMVSVSRPDNAGVMDHRGAYSPRVLIFWPLGSQLDSTDHRKTLFSYRAHYYTYLNLELVINQYALPFISTRHCRDFGAHMGHICF